MAAGSRVHAGTVVNRRREEPYRAIASRLALLRRDTPPPCSKEYRGRCYVGALACAVTGTGRRPGVNNDRATRGRTNGLRIRETLRYAMAPSDIGDDRRITCGSAATVRSRDLARIVANGGLSLPHVNATVSIGVDRARKSRSITIECVSTSLRSLAIISVSSASTDTANIREGNLPIS